MKKTSTLLFIILFALQFTAAQNTLYVVSTDGELSAYTANKVIFDKDLFTFTYGDVTKITQESFSASFNVAFKSEDYKSLSPSPEVGICFSDVNECPTISDNIIKKGTSLTNYSFSIYCLDAGTTYYYRAYVKLNDEVYYGEVCHETTYGQKPKIINGHKFVDLGLPSGLLWATCNIGAETAADDGYYFAWGETEAKSQYDWDTYKHGTSSDNLTKYNSTDGKTVLDKEDDAACTNWGSPCRMPTQKELGEIWDNCTKTWIRIPISDNTFVMGKKFTSTKNGNSIFFPASGYRSGTTLNRHDENGYYWTSSTDTKYVLPYYFGSF